MANAIGNGSKIHLLIIHPLHNGCVTSRWPSSMMLAFFKLKATNYKFQLITILIIEIYYIAVYLSIQPRLSFCCFHKYSSTSRLLFHWFLLFLCPRECFRHLRPPGTISWPKWKGGHNGVTFVTPFSPLVAPTQRLSSADYYLSFCGYFLTQERGQQFMTVKFQCTSGP